MQNNLNSQRQNATPKPVAAQETKKRPTMPLDDIVARTSDLPALSTTSLEVMRAIDSPNSTAGDVANLLSRDQSLSIRVLRLANSSYYGMRSTVDSLRRAFQVLSGPAAVRMISNTPGSGVITSQNESPRYANVVERLLTRHALSTGMITARMAGENVLSGGPAFTAGLLHDVGKHLLLYNFAEKAKGVYGESSLWDQIKGTDLHSVEQLAFGVNHSEVGEFLGRKMNFPESLTVILSKNSAPDPATHAPKQYPLIWITHAASLFSSSTGYAAGKRVSMNCSLENPIWQILVDDQIVGYQKVSALMDELHSLNDTISSACSSSLITSKTNSRGLAMNSDHDHAPNSRSIVPPLSLRSDSEY